MDLVRDAGRISSTTLSLELRADGVAVLSLQPEEGRPNLVTSALLEALDAQLEQIEKDIEAGNARALLIHSTAPGTFLAGVDLDEVLQLPDEAAAAEYSRQGQRVLRRLEQLPVPTVAAIDGACVGAGLELALACGYRIASSSRQTQLGLFHIRIGMTPAFGGTVRLPRLIGLQASLRLLLSGDSLGGDQAHEMGLVDRVEDPADLEQQAITFALQRAEKGRARSLRRRLSLRLVEETAPGRRLTFVRAARQLRRAAGELSPAGKLVMEMLAETINQPLERAFASEAELAARLMVSEPARALVHAYRVGRSSRQLAATSGVPELAGVLGAGEVGVELAFSLISVGIAVRLRDRRRETLGLGVRRVLSSIAEVRLADKITEEEADRRGDLLTSGAGFGGFGALEIILAAEGEGDGWVRAALAEAADHSSDRCILAFASPLLSATDLQLAIGGPERVIGFHPVMPTGRFPLVEIAPGENTSRETTAACVALARRLGRTVVEVRSAAATPATRLLGAYFSEALHLLDEGASVAIVDRAAETFGFRMGPFRRIDALGPQRTRRYLRHLSEQFGSESFSTSPLLELAIQEGGEFYLRNVAGTAVPNPALPGGPLAEDGGKLEEVRRRLFLRLVNQAADLLQEAAVTRPIDLELISLSALGFPRMRGGLFFHADRAGIPGLVAELEEHTRQHGSRFAPAAMLRTLAERGESFFASGIASGQPESRVLS
jgi:3-hydroxyacyl-CoA dehydrogenase / enoyl-CoA hydratase / 3-hydroxybutyryl-CoA epimerase